MGSSRKQVIGYKYYLPFVLGICMGPVDRMLRLGTGEVELWRGSQAPGRLAVHKPNAYGGEKKEGGFSGFIDFHDGNPVQPRNDFIQQEWGALGSAYRRITSLVFRRPYLGNSPSLRSPDATFERILQQPDYRPQWYPEKARIENFAIDYRRAMRLYIAMDVSSSMAGQRIVTLKTALVGLLDQLEQNRPTDGLHDIRIVSFANTQVGAIQRINCDAAGFTALRNFVNGATLVGGTNFLAAVSSAVAWYQIDRPATIPGLGSLPTIGDVSGPFSKPNQTDTTKRRVLLFVTDGVPTTGTDDQAKTLLDGIPDLDRFGFNIELLDTSSTAKIDNTPRDGVPVVPSNNPDLLRQRLLDGLAVAVGDDLNPAHAIREALVCRAHGFGMARPEAEIDDASFRAAADLFHQEGFGISYEYRTDRGQDAQYGNYIQSIANHVNAFWGINPTTGRVEIIPVRKNYNVNTLPVIGDADIVEVEAFSRRNIVNAVNTIILNYRDPATMDRAAITVHDPALIQMAGRSIVAELTFEMCRNHAMAARIAERELWAASAPLASGTLLLRRSVGFLKPGSVVVVEAPQNGIPRTVARIMAPVSTGDGVNNAFRVTFTEDIYSVAQTSIFERSPPQIGGAVEQAEPVVNRLVREAPYWSLVQALGESEAAQQTQADPTAGVWQVSGVRPNVSAISANVTEQVGSLDPEVVEDMTFAPGGRLARPLSRNAGAQNVFLASVEDDMSITAGMLMTIGAEHVVVTDATRTVLPIFGAGLFGRRIFEVGYSLVVARGALDTVPMSHAAGTPVIGQTGYLTIGGTTYGAGQSVNLRLLTQTPDEILPYDAAPEDTVAFNGRAARPYPPGNFRVDGNLPSEDEVSGTGSLVLTWAHRDRLQQTVEPHVGHLVGSIGPEPGTTYRVVGRDQSGVLWAFDTPLTTATVSPSAPPPFFGRRLFGARMFQGGSTARVIEVYSVRNGLVSWTAPSVNVSNLAPPGNLQATIL